MVSRMEGHLRPVAPLAELGLTMMTVLKEGVIVLRFGSRATRDGFYGNCRSCQQAGVGVSLGARHDIGMLGSPCMGRPDLNMIFSIGVPAESLIWIECSRVDFSRPSVSLGHSTESLCQTRCEQIG